MQQNDPGAWLVRGAQVLCVLVVLTMPTQYAVPIPVPGVPKAVNVQMADVLLWVTFGLMLVVRVVFGRSVLKVPPVAGVFLVIGTLLSVAHATHRVACLKEAFKCTEYFIVALAVFAAWGTRAKRIFRGAFLAAAGAVLVWTAVDYFRASVGDFFISGSFGNRNALGAFLALAGPALFAYFLARNPAWLRAVSLALVAAGFLLTTSGGSLIAMSMGLIVVAALRGRGALAATLAAVVLFLTAIPDLPARPRGDLLHSSISPLHPKDDSFALSARFRRWHAALNMIRSNLVSGVGAGNYQANIGMYYEFAECKPSGRTDDPSLFDTNADEPDSFNLYLVQAGETGLVGLACLLFLLSEFLRRAVRNLRAADGSLDSDSLAAVGALTGFALVAIFSSPLVRGVALPFVFLMSLAASSPGVGPSSPASGKGRG